MRLESNRSACLIIERDHTSAATTRPGIACRRWFGWRSRCADTACVMAGSQPRCSLITKSLCQLLPTCGSLDQTCKRCAPRATPARRNPNQNNGMAFLRCHWHGDFDAPLACHYFIRNRGGVAESVSAQDYRAWHALCACLSIFEMKLDRYHDILSGEVSGAVSDRWHGVRSVAKFACVTCERK